MNLYRHLYFENSQEVKGMELCRCLYLDQVNSFMGELLYFLRFEGLWPLWR
jgi:hypothetical protein